MNKFVIRCLIVAMTVAFPIALLWTPPANACSSCPSSCPTPCQNSPGVDTIPGIGNTFLDRFFNPGGGSDPYGFGPGENPVGFGPARPPEPPFVSSSRSAADFPLQELFVNAAVYSGFAVRIHLFQEQKTRKWFVLDPRDQNILGGPFDTAEEARNFQREAIEKDQAGAPPDSPATTNPTSTATTTGTATTTTQSGSAPARPLIGDGRDPDNANRLYIHLGYVGAALFGRSAIDPVMEATLLSGQRQPPGTAPTAEAGTDAMDSVIDEIDTSNFIGASATQTIQDTLPAQTKTAPPANIGQFMEEVRLPNGTRVRVPTALSLNGKKVTKIYRAQPLRVTDSNGTTSTKEIIVVVTEDGAHGLDTNGNNLGPMHESRNQQFMAPGEKRYSFDDNYPLPSPAPGQTAGASDDQASLPAFQDGFESGDTSGWATTSSILSDRRLKTDIVRVGQLPSGLPVYRYRYVWSPAIHIGVMAQEAMRLYPDAVRTIDGFLAVDYSRIR